MIKIFFLFCLFFSFSCEAGEEYIQTPFYTGKGEAVTLSEFKGKPLIVFIWSKNCSICRRSLVSLDTLSKQYSQTELKIFSIMSNKSDINDARRLMINMDIRFLAIYLDRENLFANSVGLKGFPLLLLINKEGEEVKRITGKVDFQSKGIEHELQTLMKE